VKHPLGPEYTDPGVKLVATTVGPCVEPGQAVTDHLGYVGTPVVVVVVVVLVVVVVNGPIDTSPNIARPELFTFLKLALPELFTFMNFAGIKLFWIV
jgi:hypothetical protein